MAHVVVGEPDQIDGAVQVAEGTVDRGQIGAFGHREFGRAVGSG